MVWPCSVPLQTLNDGDNNLSIFILAVDSSYMSFITRKRLPVIFNSVSLCMYVIKVRTRCPPSSTKKKECFNQFEPKNRNRFTEYTTSLFHGLLPQVRQCEADSMTLQQREALQQCNNTHLLYIPTFVRNRRERGTNNFCTKFLTPKMKKYIVKSAYNAVICVLGLFMHFCMNYFILNVAHL